MDHPRVDYDQLASTYHTRYANGKLDGIADALTRLARERSARIVLEVGCGTAHFVETLRSTGAAVYGADLSAGMLGQASARIGPEGLTQANANKLPFRADGVDLIFCVNALHHFDDPRAFIGDAATILRPGGTLAIVGIDPRAIRRRYYYEYFDGAHELDMRRYPSFGNLLEWVIDAGLDNSEARVVETSIMAFSGKAVLEDPFLRKESNSLLALLPDEVYARGVERIRTAAEQGAEFRSELDFVMITGRRRTSVSATGRR